LPSAAEPMRGSILRGWRYIVARGYVAVYQDCRGRQTWIAGAIKHVILASK
jgi:hypothetical protein